jgi:hypothetical protein
MPSVSDAASPRLEGMVDIHSGRSRRTALRALLAVSILLLAVAAVAAAALWPSAPPSARDVERRILASPRITLASVPIDRRDDLSPAMLEGMLDMSATYTFRVAGVTGDGFDVDRIGGRPVVASGAVERQFRADCRAHGATEVLQQIDYVYCGWPR